MSFNNPLDLSKQISIERMKEYVIPKVSTSYYEEDFFGKIEVNPTIFSEGRNVMTKPVFSLLQNMASDPNAPKMRINSSLRHKHQAESKKNPKSAHLDGDAVDLRIVDGNKLDMNVIRYVFNTLSKDDYKDFNLLIEFKEDDDNYRKVKAEFPNNTVITGTDPHIHLEYKRTLNN